MDTAACDVVDILDADRPVADAQHARASLHREPPIT
jgi:hypothetical protein